MNDLVVTRRRALRLDAAAAGVLRSRQRDAALSVGSTAPQFARFIELKQQRWKPVNARAKFKLD